MVWLRACLPSLIVFAWEKTRPSHAVGMPAATHPARFLEARRAAVGRQAIMTKGLP
jgi:hypothetical protein